MQQSTIWYPLYTTFRQGVELGVVADKLSKFHDKLWEIHGVAASAFLMNSNTNFSRSGQCLAVYIPTSWILNIWKCKILL